MILKGKSYTILKGVSESYSAKHSNPVRGTRLDQILSWTEKTSRKDRGPTLCSNCGLHGVAAGVEIPI